MRSGIPWVTPVLPVTVSGLEVLLNSFLLVHPLMWLKPPAVGPPIPFFDIGGLWMILHRTIFIAYTMRSVDRGVDIRPPLGASHGLGGHRVGLALFLLRPSALEARWSSRPTHTIPYHIVLFMYYNIYIYIYIPFLSIHLSLVDSALKMYVLLDSFWCLLLLVSAWLKGPQCDM